MGFLSANNISFTYGIKELYNDSDLRIFKGDKAVLVGDNGSGKSTLLKILNKEIIPDKGSVFWQKDLKVGYLDQYAKLDDNLIVKKYLYDVFLDLFEKEEQMNNYYNLISNSNMDSNTVDKYLNYAASIQDYLLDNNFYAIKSLVSNVIHGLGLNMEVLNKPIKHLSGGMRAKIILAKLLLEENDVLLLDEPTNFLDIDHIEWLSRFLKEYEGSYLVVSHDEAFLKEIAEIVFAIEHGKINRYKGDYNYYLNERVVRFEFHQKEYEKQQKVIRETKEFINKNIVRASTSKRAKSRKKMLDKLQVIKPLKQDLDYHFSFPVKSSTGENVLKIKDLEIGYNYSLVESLNFTIRRKEKVVITGENGIGKSTFIKTILNQIPKISGTYEWIDTAKISYLKQDSFFKTDDTAFELLNYKYHNFDKEKIYSLLAEFGINYEMANRPLNTLSGGEQTKVNLSLLKYEYGNVLILDEPTNHLDVIAKKALKEALQKYEGTLILVSHEKDFYEEICDYEITLY